MVAKKERSARLSSVAGGLVYRLFYPQVAMVVCSKFRASVGAMPAVSCFSISNDPPLVALAVSLDARTGRIIRDSKKFSINWLDQRSDELRRLILDLANPSRGPDKLRENSARYRTRRGTPVIVGCTAYAVCTVRAVNRHGDHDLFLAEVEDARAEVGAFRDYWDFKSYKPSIYVGSGEALQLRTL